MEEPKSNIRSTEDHFTISGILAGFSFTVGVQLLALEQSSLLIEIAVSALFISGSLFIGLTYFFFLTKPSIYLIDKEGIGTCLNRYGTIVDRMFIAMTIAMLLLLTGISLAAWTLSTIVGIAVTASAIISIVIGYFYGGEVVLIAGGAYQSVDNEKPTVDKKA